MGQVHSPTLASATSLPLPHSLTKLAELIYELVDERVESSLRTKQAELRSEQETADAEAQRLQRLVDKFAVAERLNIAPQTAWEYYRKKTLAGVKVGGKILFRLADVEALLKSQTLPDGRRKYARRTCPQKSH